MSIYLGKFRELELDNKTDKFFKLNGTRVIQIGGLEDLESLVVRGVGQTEVGELAFDLFQAELARLVGVGFVEVIAGEADEGDGGDQRGKVEGASLVAIGDTLQELDGIGVEVVAQSSEDVVQAGNGSNTVAGLAVEGALGGNQHTVQPREHTKRHFTGAIVVSNVQQVVLELGGEGSKASLAEDSGKVRRLHISIPRPKIALP